MEPNELCKSRKTVEHSKQMGVKGALLNYRGNGLMVRIKYKSDLREWSTVSNGDLAGLAIPGPKVLHGYHIRSSFTWPETACLPSSH